MPYVLTPLAKADIFDIWSWIADDSEDAADRVEQAIYDACAFVAEAPMRGHSRPDLTTRSLRFWTLTRYPNYAIVYWPDKAPVEIVAPRTDFIGQKQTPSEEAFRTLAHRQPVRLFVPLILRYHLTHKEKEQ